MANEDLKKSQAASSPLVGSQATPTILDDTTKIDIFTQFKKRRIKIHH